MRAVLIVVALITTACGPATSSSGSPFRGAQPEPGHPRCVKGGGDTTAAGFFEFQVERPAEPRSVPAGPSRPGPAAALVQFIVDTAGVAEPATVKIIEPSQPVSARLLAAVATWRFAPAEVYGCRVRQVVQVPVSRAIL